MNLMEDLKAYVDGELSPARREEIEAAMLQDERLRQELEEVRVLSRLIGDCVIQPEPVGLEQTLLRLEAKKSRSWSGLLPRYAWVAALGCVLLIAVVANLRAPANEAVSMATANKAASAPAGDASIAGASSGEAEKQSQTSDGGIALNGAPGGGGMPQGRAPAEEPTLGAGKGYSLDYRATVPKREAKARASYAQPLLIKTGNVGLRVKSVAESQASATAVATAVGGYVESSSRSSDEMNVPTADLTLRVPEPRFDDAMKRLRGLGEVRSESVTGQDVTTQVADVEARMKVMRAEEESYVTMLRAARRVGELLEIKDRLSQVRQEIESLDAQQKALRDQASYSTITVNLTQIAEAGKPKIADSWLDEAWASAVNRGSAFGRWIAAIGMNLLVFSPIWLPIVFGFWWWGRRRKTR